MRLPFSRNSVDTRGQATVEYLIVGLALIAVVTALGLLAGKLGTGLFIEQALKGASHALQGNLWGATGDVLLY